MAPATTLITVAPTGAESRKDDVPALPVTLDELVSAAKACEAAGAGLVHVHIRDDQAQPSLDLDRLKDTVAALREQTSLVVQLSTGGSVTDGYDARLRVLEAEPDSCSLTCGTVNFGDDVFTDFNLNEGDRINNENFDRQVELVTYIAGQGYHVDFTHTDDFLFVLSLVPDPELEAYLNNDFMLP